MDHKSYLVFPVIFRQQIWLVEAAILTIQESRIFAKDGSPQTRTSLFPCHTIQVTRNKNWQKWYVVDKNYRQMYTGKYILRQIPKKNYVYWLRSPFCDSFISPSKANSPQHAISYFTFQVPVYSPFLKVIQLLVAYVSFFLFPPRLYFLQ